MKLLVQTNDPYSQQRTASHLIRRNTFTKNLFTVLVVNFSYYGYMVVYFHLLRSLITISLVYFCLISIDQNKNSNVNISLKNKYLTRILHTRAS